MDRVWIGHVVVEWLRPETLLLGHRVNERRDGPAHVVQECWFVRDVHQARLAAALVRFQPFQNRLERPLGHIFTVRGGDADFSEATFSEFRKGGAVGGCDFTEANFTGCRYVRTYRSAHIALLLGGDLARTRP